MEDLEEKREGLWIVFFEVLHRMVALARWGLSPVFADHGAAMRAGETDDGERHTESFCATFEDDVAP